MPFHRERRRVPPLAGRGGGPRRTFGPPMKGVRKMARKNRIVVEDGLYHVTARVAHRAFLLADEAVKEKIVTWMYGIADFCGIDVAAWNIMDSHLHVFLHVPTVPEEYWTDPGTLPAAAWRSMRPAECRDPRWSPDVSDRDYPITPCGDCPSEEALVKAAADGVPVVTLPRPKTGFAIPEDELLRRLGRLYYGHSNGAEKIARRWERLRSQGRDAEVEEEKDALFRRMYSVSQYMKTLKQRISEYFNRELGHAGQLWDGRFHSTLVEKDELAKLYVSSYIEWNAPKAGMAGHPRQWKWCSYSAACGSGAFSSRARNGYERLFGSWEDAKARLEAVFEDRLPDSWKSGETNADGKTRLRMSQLIKVASLSKCAFFSRRLSFVEATLASLPSRFPCTGPSSVEYLSRFDWEMPRHAA